METTERRILVNAGSPTAVMGAATKDMRRVGDAPAPKTTLSGTRPCDTARNGGYVMFRFAGAVAFLTFVSALAHPGPCYVSMDGGNRAPFRTWEDAATRMQDAVKAAEAQGGADAAIVVRKGVYTDGGDEAVATITQSLLLRSETGDPTDVVIDGQGKRRGLLLKLTTPGAIVTIQGITVRNGFADANGAGISVDHSAVAAGQVELRACVIVDNTSGRKRPRLCGGGLASTGRKDSTFHTILSGCRFAGNTVIGPRCEGGGAAFRNTRLTVKDCHFERNASKGTNKRMSHGGGIYIENAIEGSVISRTVFRGNEALGGGGGTTGGGLAVYGKHTNLLIEGCHFVGNAAPYGSALMQFSGSIELRRSRIAGNKGSKTLWLGWAKKASPATKIVNSTIAGGVNLSRAGTVKVVDAMRDPAVFIDAKGEVKPVRTVEEANLRREATLRRIEILAGHRPVKSAFPAVELKTLQDDVIDGKLRRQKIEYFTDSREVRVRAWLFSPTPVSCLEAGATPENSLAAVLCLHQTNRKIGKDEPAGLRGKPNMHYALELARLGFVTLAPDSPNCGEYPRMSDFRHDHVSATMKGVADSMRAVDILAGLHSVDPQRIGCIGHSLGGFNTMFVAAFDARIKAIVSSCGYTTWGAYASRERNLYNFGGPNYMPRIRSCFSSRPDLAPFDWHEVLAACAPRPVFINAPLRDDPFLVDGVRETIAAARPVYHLFGARDALQSVHPDTGHDFPLEARNQAYEFFKKCLAAR